jgi:hypothetical protein
MHDEKDYTPNVYLVTVPMVTCVTLRVEGPPDMDTDDLVSEAVRAWKRGEDTYGTGATFPDYDNAYVDLHEDNNPETQIDDDYPAERDHAE